MGVGQKQFFQITVRFRGLARRVLVSVHDSLDELRAAADQSSDGFTDHSRALAVTSRWQRITYTPDGDSTTHPDCAHIRLVRDHLTMGVITHEVGHAALHIWQLGNEDMSLSTDDIDGEEEFCYLLGDIAARLVRRLTLYGFYEQHHARVAQSR